MSLDDLQLANKVAHAATTGGMVRHSFRSEYDEARDRGKIAPGEYLVLGDCPLNHAAMAILETFGDRTDQTRPLRQSMLWRAIFTSSRVYADPRAARYMKRDEEGEWVGHPLLEAIATTPMRFDEGIPVDAIFETAAQIAAEEDWHNDGAA